MQLISVWTAATRRLAAGVAIAMLAVVVAGCASPAKEYDPTTNWTVERLYSDAKDEMGASNWPQALKQLQRLESRFPFGVYAQQAQIDIAYVYWKDGNPAEALAAIERFQRLHPSHPNLDYMLYLKGVINFYRDSPFLASLAGQDPSERDPKGARESFDAFKELVSKYPDSRYAPDARQRLTYLVNGIAQNETHVARFYYERGAYLASVNRAQTVVRDFQGTPAVEEALYIQALAYERLGMNDLRDDTRRVLTLNFPQSRFVQRGFDERSKPWWQIF